MKTSLALFVAAALLAAGAWADAPVYKWVDAQGHVHYGPQPQGDQAQQIDVVNKGQGIPAASGATSATPASANPSSDSSLTQAMPADSAACKAAREKLAQYLNADYLYTLGDKGDKQKMSKEDQDKTIAQAKDNVTKTCSLVSPP